jgi:hypothetical protein
VLQYPRKEVDVSLALLLEMMDALKGYGADIIVVGVWAPYFLLLLIRIISTSYKIIMR